MAVLTVGLAGCSASASSSDDGDAAASRSSSAPAEIKVTPADDATQVAPDDEVVVQVMRGDLGSVTVTDDAGEALEGASSGQEWRSTQRLTPGSTYTVAVDATGPGGAPTTHRTTFTAHEPAVTATYSMVAKGATVGVAMPVSIQFDSAVTDASYRREIEKAVSVTTVPKTEGSWGWLDDRQLMWRPKDFWAAGTKVSVNAPLTGYQTGPDKWVDEDVSGSMTIGREQLTTVDIADHTMTVSRGGQEVTSFPVSSGKPGPETETRSGMKVVLGKQEHMTMDSATIGISPGQPGYYKVDTDWNVRVTWTGEFLHSAPWSVGAQGSSNVSHGCVNLAPANAKWVYDNSLIGDPVDFTGSSREFLPTEGIGVWQYSWQDWQEQSAVS